MYDQLQGAVAPVPIGDASPVIDVLVESFYNYPVMRFVLGNAPDYDARLKRLIGLFVSARLLLNDVILGIRNGEEVWSELGPTAKARYDLCVNAWGAIATDVPQLHVNMIGVRNAHQRKGLARALLSRIHEMALQSGTWQGVSLTTEDPRNVAFYEGQGYRVIGTQMVAPELQAWSFFRVNE
jgi:GNAT superfamily N-acetyltransferase